MSGHIEDRWKRADRKGKGNRWRVRWREDDGRQRNKMFARKADAERHLAEVVSSMARGTYLDPGAGRVCFRDYAETWRTAQAHRPTTAAQAETHLRRHAYPVLGDRPLGAVRRTEVQALVTRLAETLAPSTVRTVHSYVAAVFKAAVADRLIATSPCQRIALPKATPARVEPLSVDAVEALADAVPDRYRALLVLGAGTGLRQGEALGITVDRIDFLRRTLRVDRQLVLMAGAPPYLAPPKTPASVRTIPLPRVVVDALAAHLAAYPAQVRDIEYRAGAGAPVVERVALVFTTESGTPIRRTRFSDRVWCPAVETVRTAAAEDESAPRLPVKAPTFHDLRHFYASLLIRHGESVKTVQARLGHASAAETLDTYSHLWPDSDDRTREAVDTVLGAAEAQARPEAADDA